MLAHCIISNILFWTNLQVVKSSHFIPDSYAKDHTVLRNLMRSQFFPINIIKRLMICLSLRRSKSKPIDLLHIFQFCPNYFAIYPGIATLIDRSLEKDDAQKGCSVTTYTCCRALSLTWQALGNLGPFSDIFAHFYLRVFNQVASRFNFHDIVWFIESNLDKISSPSICLQLYLIHFIS